MKKSSRISSLCAACLLLSSCSLKYSESVNVDDKVPEFVFEDTQLIRYESNKPTLEVHAGVLEQCKNSNESYAKDIEFKSYDDDGKLSTEGACGYLSADTDKDLYALYDNITVNNIEEKMKFYANSLSWNSATEQLVGGRGDMVKVEKDDIIIRGSGFSSSGISKEFSFTGNVVGNIETKDDELEDESEGNKTLENENAAE